MRAKKAKAIRKAVYGTFSRVNEREYRYIGKTRVNNPEGKRAKYRFIKKNNIDLRLLVTTHPWW